MLQAQRIHHEIVPSATALLLNDVTRAFVDPGGALEIPAARDILAGLADLARACRVAGSLVVYVGYVQTAVNRAEMGKSWPSLLDGALDKGAVGSEVTEVLKPATQDWVIEKKTYSAFLGTDLEARLTARGVDTIIVGGVSTNHACYTAARDAQCRGFRVIFLSDGNGEVVAIRDVIARL